MLTVLLSQPINMEYLWKLEANGITDACQNKTKDELEKVGVGHFR
jgi:hypothetical protein